MLDMLGAGVAKLKTQTANGTANANQSSPFAQLLTGLQQLRQTSSTQYAKVSQQVSSNLSTAATKAQGQGNATLASELNILSKDFATASQTGKLPNFHDLETAMHAGDSNQQAKVDIGGSPVKGSHFNPLKIIGQALSLAGV